MTDETTAPETGDENWKSEESSDFSFRLEPARFSLGRAAYRGSFDKDAIDRLAKLGADSTEPKVVMIPTDGLEPGLPRQVPILWDRETQTPISVIEYVEEARPRQVRRGTAKVETLDSFVDLTNRHKDEDSVIFAATSYPNPKLTAVIDYHTSAHEARWGKHRVEYAFPLTKEFRAWIDGDSTAMEQFKFAVFLEEHASELAAPEPEEKSEFERLFKERFATPSELLDLSRSLEIYVGGTVKNQGRVQSGERQLVFTSEHTNGKGEPIDIPGIFMVSVPPFLEGKGPVDSIRLPARIRYRIQGGDIVWFYQLYRWEHVLRDRIQRDLMDAASRTALPAFEGAPEMAA